MELDFRNLYNIISLTLTVIFSLYILLSKVKEREGNIFIGLFILSIGLGNLDYLLSQINFYTSYPNLWLILAMASFLFSPLMYFYIKSVAFKGQKISYKDAIHLVPIIAVIIINIFQYYSKPFDVKLKLLTGEGLYEFFIPVVYTILHTQALIYMVLSILVVKRFKQIVKENYSNYNKRNYKWIYQLNFVFVYFIISGVVSNSFRFFVGESTTAIYAYISAPINILFLLWLMYKAISQPYLFNGIDSNIKLLEDLLKERDVYKKEMTKNASTDDYNLQANELKIRLETLMSNDKPYLNPSLAIFDLAKELVLPSSELSIFLNKHLNKNFFDFINEYRINEAKRLLISSERNNHTILEILYEVGFNSKSSFNTAFKKFTNKTPTEYRKRA